MAYETSNPIKKIGQAGDTNSLWYYTDGDAIATIAASGAATVTVVNGS